jgi:hypothetical protein
MVKIRTVIPQNAKPGTSVIQVVNPKTNKPTRIRVPANAQPGQVIELELPDDSTKSTPSSTAKLGGIPAAKSIDSRYAQDGISYDKSRNTRGKQNVTSSAADDASKPSGSAISKSLASPVPPQYSIDTPSDSKNSLSTKNHEVEAGCCSSFFSNPFRWCGSLCS